MINPAGLIRSSRQVRAGGDACGACPMKREKEDCTARQLSQPETLFMQPLMTPILPGMPFTSCESNSNRPFVPLCRTEEGTNEGVAPPVVANSCVANKRSLPRSDSTATVLRSVSDLRFDPGLIATAPSLPLRRRRRSSVRPPGQGVKRPVLLLSLLLLLRVFPIPSFLPSYLLRRFALDIFSMRGRAQPRTFLRGSLFQLRRG